MTTADCSDCESEHSLGERPYNGFTTECPNCNSTSYKSVADGGKVTASEADRIVNTVFPIDGVGDETAANIVNHFDLYAEMERASIEELCSIDGVGKTVAERIQKAVR